MGAKYDALSDRERKAVDRQVALLNRDEQPHRRSVLSDDDRKEQLAAIPGNAKALANMFEQIDKLVPPRSLHPIPVLPQVTEGHKQVSPFTETQPWKRLLPAPI